MFRFAYSYRTLLLLFFLASSCTSPTTRTISELDVLLDSLQLKYVPDDRIEWWDVSIQTEERTVQIQGTLSCRETYDALVKEVARQFPEVENQLVLLPEDENDVVVNALVNNSVIHLRKEPSSTKELITQARLGAPVRILLRNGGKSLIQIPDGYIGWVNTEELRPVSQAELAAYRESEKLIFTAQYGLSYLEPDVESMPVSDLVIGNIVSKVAEKSGFTQVLYPDGRLGWVNSQELVPAEEIFFKTPRKEDLVQTALKFNGIPYLWGGTSSKNIDCSGLVCNVYFMNGIQLPRDADMQALIGRELNTVMTPDGLEPGDLLFFGRKATEEREENVTHVAMYIGDKEYIHSAGYRERVSINSMDSSKDSYIERYPEIFVRTVRILGEEYEGFRPIAENEFYKEIIAKTE